MTSGYVTEQVLMIVKTYPTPSRGYGETVCTAGIRLRDQQWLRIYPYPFRLIEGQLQFDKWQVIEVPLQKAPNDPRPESYRLYDSNQIRRVRKIETGGRDWTERMTHIRATAFPSVASVLDGIPPKGDQNWGATIRPVEVQSGAKFRAVPTVRDWSADDLGKLEQAQVMAGGGLFGTDLSRKYRPLQKVPYDFRLTFRDLTGAEYDYKILDWEIPVLYFKMAAKYGEETALEKVRYRIEEEIFVPDNQVFLVLGNMHHTKKQKFLGVDGFIYPRRPVLSAQLSLFGD